MPVSSVPCTARRHGRTRYARRVYNCTCPAAVEATRRHDRRYSAIKKERHKGGTGRTQPRHRLVDPVAVEEVVAGTLGIAERRIVIDNLTDRGVSAIKIAEILGINSRTVYRRRAARRSGVAPNGATI